MKAKQQSTYFEKAIAEISSFQQLGGKEGGWEGGRVFYPSFRAEKVNCGKHSAKKLQLLFERD